MKIDRTGIVPVLFMLTMAIACASVAQSSEARVDGTVLDPVGRTVPEARVEFDSPSGEHSFATTGSDGSFTMAVPARGLYSIRVEAAGFVESTRALDLNSTSTTVTLRLERVRGDVQEVTVSADAGDIAIESPDPSQKVMVREELLDANPGRPGAPVSIPGMPVETAAGGIKAPQYFAPGVAGDHGEPIGQYIALGGYLIPNNLSANAHGNGYADPNIYVSGVLGSVATDGGAFNVREGDHALNLAATYSFRPMQQPFLAITSDHRDLDLTAAFAPAETTKKEWIALEVNYGNGLMRTLEHRTQFKWNGFRGFHPGQHQIAILGIGYWGASHEGNLVPIGFGLQVNDTLDPRQKDQTHTGLLAADDQWRVSSRDAMAFSGFLRTYNLALFSNFGEGLIRQSEFRTVEGGEVREIHAFSSRLEGLAGLLYNEDDIHNDDLDHFLSPDPGSYGSFVPVLGNNLTIRELAPYLALRGNLGKRIQFYAGLRHEEIGMRNIDKLRPPDSFDQWQGFEEPKATVAWSPGAGPTRWLPSASFSVGQAFFTEDPRIHLAPTAVKTGAQGLVNPFERSHAEQLVVEKTFGRTQGRVTVGRTTMTGTLAKIDPDNGSADDLGPSTLKFLTASARHQFSSGTLQAVFSKADARLQTFQGNPATVVPEAPRTIVDFLTTLDKLPMGWRARGEYEYVGRKYLDAGNSQHPGPFEAIPVGELRMAAVRSFLAGRLELGVHGMLARGYTGQTTEMLAPNWTLGQTPACAPGSGPTGAYNDFACGTNELGVGVRAVCWVAGSFSWRFGAEK